MVKKNLNSLEIELINKIKTERVLSGLSQKELAERAGIKRPYLGLIESFNKRPTKNFITKIAPVLNLDIKKYKKLFEEQKINKESIEFLIPVIKLSDRIINKKEEINKLSKHIFLPHKTAEFINYSSKEYLYAYIMPDDSMEPIINKNDILIIEFFESDIFFKTSKDTTEDDAVIEIIHRNIAVITDNANLTLIREIQVIIYDEIDMGALSPDEKNYEIDFAILRAANKNYYDIEIPCKSKIKYKINPGTKSIEYIEKKGNLKIKGIVVAVLSEKILIEKEHLLFF